MLRAAKKKTSKKGIYMAVRTLAIIKPDAVAAGHTGSIINMIEDAGFTIRAMEKRSLTQDDAERFYAVHKERPFFEELVTFMSSGPVVVLALEKAGAQEAWRELMGATDPKDAAPGTIRQKFAKSIGENAVHGSDSTATAQEEIAFFFSKLA